MPHWGDWVFLAFLVVFMSWWGRADFQAFLKRAAQTSEDVLTPEYRKTVLVLSAIAIATVVIWFVSGREWADLGLAGAQWNGKEWSGLVLAAAMMLGAAINVPLAIYKPEISRQRFAAHGELLAFLPQTARQYRWGVATSVAAGVAEELAYRGFVMWVLAHFMPIYLVLAVQAVIFGVIHLYQGWVGVLTTTIMGAVFGYIYWATGSLILPILAHALANMASMTAAYLTLRAREERPEA